MTSDFKSTEDEEEASKPRSKFRREVILSFLIKIAYTGLGFASTVLLARLLNPTGLGIYSYVYALVNLLALPAQAGLPILVMRETAKGLVSKEFGLIRGVWQWASQFVLIISVIIFLVAGFILFARNELNLSDQEWTLTWGLLLIPLTCLGNLRGAALKGLHHPIAGQLPEFIIRPTILVLVLATCKILSIFVSSSNAMMLTAFASLISFIFGVSLLINTTPPEVKESNSIFHSKLWLISTIPLALIVSMRLINVQSDIIMIGIFQSPEQVGIYRISVQIATLASFGLLAVNQVVSPRFASLYHRGDMAKLQQVVTKGSRIIFFTNIAITLILILLTPALINVFFGNSFKDAYLPLLILLGGQFVNSITGSVGFLLQMTGHERSTAIALGFTAVLNILLNSVLVPKYSIVGAAVSTSISMALSNIALAWVVWKNLKINTFSFNLSFTK